MARREARLASLATELQHQFHVNAEILVADLSTSAGIERVEKRMAQLETLDMLINNAGFGVPGEFSEVLLDRSLAMIQLAMLTTARLSRGALPGMIATGRGVIINMSSIGTFIPRSCDAVYCATKAYLNAFSEALQGELRGSGVQVQALCPGFVATDFLDHPEYEVLHVKARIPKWLWTPLEDVIEASLQSLKRGQVICVPGFKNRAIVVAAESGLSGFLRKTLVGCLRQETRLPVGPR